jgi:hypothetical protein
MYAWIEGRELVLMAGRVMLIIGPLTLSASLRWGQRERGFLLHPGQSCWL